MIDYTAPIIITLINLFILVDLFKCMLQYQKKDLRSSFNLMLFELSRLLFIANTFAFLTGCIDYFIIHSTVSDVLQFGRFADRYVMYFAYRVLTKYHDTLG